MNKEPLYLLDGYGLIYRAYFAFTNRHLINPSGENVSAIQGFFRTFFSLLKKNNVTHLAVTLDSHTPTFRHEMYPEYKATRDKTPDELFEQIPRIERILEALGVPLLRYDGFEADDLLGTYAAICTKEQRPCYLVSGDKDILQLINEYVSVLKPSKGTLIPMTSEDVQEDKGVRPDQIIDFLALVGDSSDNIPGVAGIGPKTAEKLLGEFGSLEGVYDSLDQIKSASQRKKLEENRENAFLSRTLATIKTDIAVSETTESFQLPGGDNAAAAALFREYGLNGLADEMTTDSGEAAAEAAPPAEKGEYAAVLTEEDLENWVQKCLDAGLVSFDSETDSIEPLEARPVGFSLSVKSGTGCYIPLKAAGADCLPESMVRSAIKRILENKNVRLIGQNIKYDYKVLKGWGVEMANIHFDTMIAAWMIDSTRPKNMDALAEQYLQYTTVHFTDIVEKGKTFDSVPLETAVVYAAEDADITYRLYEILEKKLKENQLDPLFRNVEMPLLPILAEMEWQGIALDVKEMSRFSKELEKSLVEIEDEVYKLCGKTFNLSSTKQLQEVLFEDRKLTPGKKTKTGYSTDNGVLQELAKEDPVPDLILKYRSLSKLKSTYVDSLPQLVRQSTGRLHTHFIQTGTETGRLSSKNPNLQNIPIRDDNGRRIRRAFKPDSGRVFVSADYSQIELVVLAHLSGDDGLLTAFREGKDVHRQTASLVFGVEEAAVTDQQRRMAKTINFGVMYGMSSFRLSRQLDIPRSDADAFIEAYFERFSGVRDFVEETIRQAEQDGGVRTMDGRFRPLPQILSRNRMEKSAAGRAAVNTRIQGTAADIMKKAMLLIREALRREKLDAEMLLQVHDECILSVSEQDKDKLCILLKREMEKAAVLDIPLKVNVESGLSWGDIH